MTAICSLMPGKHRLVGGPSLSTRPVKSLVEALKMVGIRGSIEGKTTPPVVIEGGNLKGGVTELPGNISSQFVSALLLIAPFARKEMSIRLTTPLTSKPYVLMTLWCQKQFGVNVGRDFDKFVIKGQKYAPAQLDIEGDWSSASYLLALGAVSDGVEVENLKTSSLQGDRVILDFIRSMGAKVRVESGSITVNEGDLRAIQTDLSDCIDLLPTMAVLAALATGKSVFSGIERARIKESNRVAAVKEGLVRMGIEVVEDRDSLTITGMKAPPKDDEEEDDEEEKQEEESSNLPENTAETVIIDSHNDHRIAMAFGVLGAAVGNVIIDGAECVSKTYPNFWDTLKDLGVDWTQSE
jgi:3-phosphoshikimate 1-carboxyvinyltransferase